jgi:hypothetical protein
MRQRSLGACPSGSVTSRSGAGPFRLRGFSLHIGLQAKVPGVAVVASLEGMGSPALEPVRGALVHRYGLFGGLDLREVAADSPEISSVGHGATVRPGPLPGEGHRLVEGTEG